MEITKNVISEEERQVAKYLLDNINEFTDLASIYEDLKDYGTFDEVADILINLRDAECINIKDFHENGIYGTNPKRIVCITDIYKDVLKEYLEN